MRRLALALALLPSLALAQTPVLDLSLSTNFANIQSAKALGAKGDGVTDDTASLQATINTGGVVFIPPGTYQISCLTLPSGVTIFGAGTGRTILRGTNACASTAMLYGSGASDVAISNLAVNGNNIANYGILNNNNGGTVGNRWRVRDTLVQLVTLDCLSAHAGVDIVFAGNTLSNCGGNGIRLDGTASNFSVTNNRVIGTGSGAAGVIFMVGIDGSIVGNSISNSGPNGDCITGYDSTNLRVQVIGNSCLTNNNNGIHVGGTNIIVANNNLYNTSLTGIYIAAVTFPGGVKTYGAPSNYVTVSGNVLHTTTTANQSGIALLTCYHCTVTGNTVTGATQNGIMLNIANNNVVTGNQVDGTTGNGIDIRGGNQNIISGNNVSNSTGDAYRSENDTSNVTGAGTVVATQNTFVSNVSIANGRDYIESPGSNDYYNADYAMLATGGTSPVFVLGTGSIWQGIEAQSTSTQMVSATGWKQFEVKDVASTVNNIAIQGSAAGSDPQIQVQGSDATRQLILVAKGASGTIRFLSHLWSTVGAPTLSACGTGPSVTGASDIAGTITEGTTATGCTLTFGSAYQIAPRCVVSSPTGAPLTGYSTTLTTLVITNASASGNQYNYVCFD
jgi:parallel beta-helix repeat protein